MSTPVPSSRVQYVYPDGTPTRALYYFLEQLSTISSGATYIFGTVTTANSGTSGHTVPFLDGNNTWSGTQSFDDGDMILIGSSSGHTILHAAATAGGAWTFPNATDTVVGLAVAQTLTNKVISSTTNTMDVVQIAGTKTNDAASAGNLGEYISSTINTGSQVTLTSTSAVDVTSISLTAGDWDVWGAAGVTSSATGISVFRAWISSASATDPGLPNVGAYTFVPVAFSGANVQFPISGTRLSVTTTTIIFLSVRITFTGTGFGIGNLSARRRR